MTKSNTMRTSSFLIMLIVGLFLPTSTNAVVHLNHIHSAPDLALVPLNKANQAGFETQLMDNKTLEEKLGRKLNLVEKVGLWVVRKKIKKTARRLSKGKIRREAGGKALVLAHKIKDKKLRYIWVGEKIELRTKNTSHRLEGRLVDVEGDHVVVEKESGEIVTVPVQEIIGITKKSKFATFVGILGAVFLIFSIAFFIRGDSEKRAAARNSSNDFEGCFTSSVMAAGAIALITMGYIFLLIGIAILIVGIATAKRYFDLTEDSVWKLDNRETSEE